MGTPRAAQTLLNLIPSWHVPGRCACWRGAWTACRADNQHAWTWGPCACSSSRSTLPPTHPVDGLLTPPARARASRTGHTPLRPGTAPSRTRAGRQRTVRERLMARRFDGLLDEVAVFFSVLLSVVLVDPPSAAPWCVGWFLAAHDAALALPVGPGGLSP
jgi:hypothetical protein